MGKNERLVLAIGLVVVSWFGLYVPWERTAENAVTGRVLRDQGYSFLWNVSDLRLPANVPFRIFGQRTLTPTPAEERSERIRLEESVVMVTIDYGMIVLAWLVTVSASAAAILLLEVWRGRTAARQSEGT